MDEYQSTDFIEKYVTKMKDDLFEEVESKRIKINRILQKENLSIDEEANLVVQSNNQDTENRICNFAVIPTHILFYDDGEKIHEAGLAVEVYTKLHNEKYKCILVNLSDDVIDKGSWLNTTYVDRDFILYKSDFKLLKIAIKLSYRILKRNKHIKIFCKSDQVWLEDEEAIEHINSLEGKQTLIEYKQQKNSNNPLDQKLTDAIQFLSVLKTHISDIEFHPYSKDLSSDVDHDDLEDDEYFYLVYTKTWRSIRTYFNRKKINLITNDKELDHYLINEGVFESNEIRPPKGLKRADYNNPPFKKRVFKINKIGFNEFLEKNNL